MICNESLTVTMTPGPGCSPGLAAGATLPGRVHWQGEVCREDLLMIIRVESPATVRASDSDGDSAAAAAAAAPARLSADEIRDSESLPPGAP